MVIQKNLKWDNYQIKDLPYPIWGKKVPKVYDLACASCGSSSIYYSGSPADPEEIFKDTVRCSNCGWMTDYYEDYKAGRERLKSPSRLYLIGSHIATTAFILLVILIRSIIVLSTKLSRIRRKEG